MPVLRYLKARFAERSTYLLIGTGIAAASTLPWPWSLASVIVATVAALVPDGHPLKGGGE